MAEQTFRSPGFFEQEIDLAARQQGPVGVPAGIVGTSLKGPAFVPVTVGSFADFETRFGTVKPDMFGPYAVREWFKHRTALTYLRVLGAGANETTTDIETTEAKGTVKNAGFILKDPDSRVAWADDLDNRHQGVMQFLAATHVVSASGDDSFPVFNIKRRIFLNPFIPINFQEWVLNILHIFFVLLAPIKEPFEIA